MNRFVEQEEALLFKSSAFFCKKTNIGLKVGFVDGFFRKRPFEFGSETRWALMKPPNSISSNSYH
jgi:hypothetical protein